MSIWYEAHATLFQTTAIYTLLALSFQVVLRSGIFSFASVGAFGVGAYAVANLTKDGVPAAAALVIIAVAMAGVGYLLSFPLMRLRGLYLGMATFALDQIVVVVATNGGSLTGGAVGLFGIPLDVSTLELVILAVVGILLVSQLERRSVGRAIEVLRTDQRLARSLGVEVGAYRKLIFALSTALGAIAGALNALNFSTIAPGGFGFSLIVAGLTMAVVGGSSSWLGAVLGAIFVVWFPEWFASIGKYQSIIYGVLVILVVAYQPDGILGIIRWLIRAATGRRGRRSRGIPPPELGPLPTATAAGPDSLTQASAGEARP
jgi:branched-chain amino acid transport system permease protein